MIAELIYCVYCDMMGCYKQVGEGELNKVKKEGLGTTEIFTPTLVERSSAQKWVERLLNTHMKKCNALVAEEIKTEEERETQRTMNMTRPERKRRYIPEGTSKMKHSHYQAQSIWLKRMINDSRYEWG